MSQAGLIDAVSATPSVPTQFDTDSGSAVPILNTLDILGGTGINTEGSGMTVTVNLDDPVIVDNGGTGQTTLTDGAILVGNGTSAIELVGPLTDGQILIGDTAGVSPSASTLTAGTGISIVNAAGSITISSGASAALSFPTDGGTATPAANALTVAGGTGITTSGAGSTVTISLDTPVSVANGGTGASTLTDGGVLLGSGTGAVTALAQATDGQLVIGSTGVDPVLATITAGTGISISNAAGSITITAIGGNWSTVTDATQALAVENGCVGNRASAITYTLPATANVGDTIQITNIGAGLPVIAQNALQSINFTASSTTVGVGGSLTSVNQFGSIELICVVTDTTWNVVDSTGSWTIV